MTDIDRFTYMRSYHVSTDLYLTPPSPHFICISLLYKLFLPSCISKAGGYSANGMGSKLVVFMVV